MTFEVQGNSGPYDDIIHLPHYTSPTRPRMPIGKRSAQFAPFDALTGYRAAIRETARLTEERIELDEDAIAALDSKLQLLMERIADHPEIAVTYFHADEKKDGGAYVTVAGNFLRIDDYEGVLILLGGEKIVIQDILQIDCDLFKEEI